MELIIYPLLKTNSKRSIRKSLTKFGHQTWKEPRSDLVRRLCAELGWSEKQVRDQYRAEKSFIIANKQYYP